MPLTTSELQTLDRLLQQLLDLPQADRVMWIDALPESQRPFAPYLRASLNANDGTATGAANGVETADFLGALPNYREVSKDTADPVAGEQVGPYKLIRPLGEGGMGSVWFAERIDGALRREVALKLPHRDLLERGLAARMQRERDILAALNHNHIARLYDAGVDDLGRPYLALEYVPGVPIHKFCKEKNVSLNERVRLMAQVARAVAHAHANLAVHRDLKPNNILVADSDGKPQVKLLDFGVAKLLATEEIGENTADLTQRLGRALTPDYASPEQLRGEAVTTAGDVYSLGVVLYEVVAGEKPYRLKHASAAELTDIVERERVVRPSKRAAEGAFSNDAKRIAGDLDAVIAKALKLDAQQRYATASALADDLDRWLAHLPVLAQPDSWGYRAKRFARRNAPALAATGAVMMALLVGTGVALWQAREARLETAKTKAVKDFLIRVFTAGNADQEDAARRRKQPIGDVLLESTKTLPASLADQPAVKSELQATLAKLLNDMGLAEPALKMREERLREVDARPAPLAERMQARVDLAMSAYDMDDSKRAVALFEEAVAGLSGARDAQSKAVLSEALTHLAMVKVFLMGGTAAVKDAQRAVALTEQAKPGGEPHVRALYTLGFAYAYAENLPDAEAAFGKALPLGLLLPGDEGIVVADIHTRWGDALIANHQIARALDQYQKALTVVERFSGKSSFRWALNTTLLANRMAQLGRNAESEPMLREAISVFRAFDGQVSPEYRSAAEAFLASGLLDQGRLGDARKEASSAYEPFRKHVEAPGNPDAIARAGVRYGLLLQLEGAYAESDKVLGQTVAVMQKLEGPPSRDLQIARRLMAENALHTGRTEAARNLFATVVSSDKLESERFGLARELAAIGLAGLLAEQREWAAAGAQLDALTPRLAKMNDEDKAINFLTLARIESVRGTLKLGQGNAPEAAGHFQRSVDILQARQQADSPVLAGARADLALALLQQGKRAEAKALADAARVAFAKHQAVAPHLRKSLSTVDKAMARQA
jgi:eukaryotic-like serine/threonine-protein kinase